MSTTSEAALIYVRSTQTRCQQAARLLERLHKDRPPDEEGWWFGGYETRNLLAALVATATQLAPLLEPDDLEDARQDVRELTAALRARDLATKLADVTGRPAEEAAAFTRKADELGGAA